ncbi:hypothetical protein [Bifidobacterium gallicum]|uniref:Putative NADH-ubiquinone oxidoreductase chain 6 n=1 Tax=Bifidobacterium gallicum DSM 20093 = LMG 11596 TaxID=561180 RepID=D1NUV6_9BIFI|nr:hypothetical protein [Bifidobacterium gallicum]EFA22607.1 hypothetical protein BIFGAL_03633 [Bifidobacterium gallicum DSM 20093 = LMG 11596]KFI59585.1 putative NADH-ubiquinone oxidoreductase chain 6 [Bifidobacterium gallicum DSM 20093 = LMG 11596]
MKVWETIVSALGILVLFVAFLVYGTAWNASWGTVKATDLLTIIGGLMFVWPLYAASVRRKRKDGVANAWIWQGLPAVGMVLIVVGLLLPNGPSVWGLFTLPDCFYLVGVLLLLLIPFYPINAAEQAMIEDQVDDDVQEDSARH